MKTKKRKNNRRNREKYPALKPEFNLKIRSELIDYDYLDKLNDREKEWLNKFTEEYINANLNRKNIRKNLHNTKKLKRDCDKRNNDRNADILSREKAIYGNALYLEDLKKEENKVIEFLGMKETNDLDDSGSSTNE